MDPDGDSPYFPRELEREIFETAAELYPETIPTLLLVALRVLEWIEPLGYRTFFLAETRSTSQRFRFLQHAIQSKPAHFIRTNIWYLLAGTTFTAGTLNDVLPHCTGIRSLVLFHACPSMLSQLKDTQPRRLAIPIASLFHDQDTRVMDFTLPFFACLTHLDVFEILNDLNSWSSSWTTLGLLPGLTHLAFLELCESALIAEILVTCTKLKVLIGMHSEAPPSWEDMPNIPVDEARFVSMAVSTTDYIMDWEVGTKGGMDFWARADAFVAKRRRGEIEPRSRHWIEDRDEI
ncbi:hypothetical protein MVEN_00260100 [Mycena venus]|uniref:Uncharacterized protein n=1 Tax=Mycena venus TaxID=2733690 RepID=A0A8H6Z2J7_9AGAR|nr:hypothetical protein MVEN_00260100 [Mycena venus]